MARVGNPYENALMESFFKTLKYEEVYLCEYETLKDVRDRPYCVNRNCYRRGMAVFGTGLSLIQQNAVLPHRTLLTLSVQS